MEQVKKFWNTEIFTVKGFHVTVGVVVIVIIIYRFFFMRK